MITQVQNGQLDETNFRRSYEAVCSSLRNDDAKLGYWDFVRLYLLVDNEEMQRKRRRGWGLGFMV